MPAEQQSPARRSSPARAPPRNSAPIPAAGARAYSRSGKAAFESAASGEVSRTTYCVSKWKGSEMADIDRFSERLVDLAERFADVTDAAQGRGNRQGGIRARWFVVPAAAAGVYLLGASGSLRRQAGNVAKQAKDRASDLPDDLMSRVHRATRKTTTSRQVPTAARRRGRPAGHGAGAAVRRRPARLAETKLGPP